MKSKSGMKRSARCLEEDSKSESNLESQQKNEINNSNSLKESGAPLHEYGGNASTSSDKVSYQEENDVEESDSELEFEEDDDSSSSSDLEERHSSSGDLKNDIKRGPNHSDSLTEEKVVDEYEVDSSDEEDVVNTVGNIPMKWYDDFSHLGYDHFGEKIMKPPSYSDIQNFLDQTDDPNYWRTVTNNMTGERVVLSDEIVDFIKRIQKGMYPNDENKYQIFEDLYSHEVMEHPINNEPDHKSSFIPSKIEKRMVDKILYSIKMGWMKPKAPKEDKTEYPLLWDQEVEPSKRMRQYIPAPKRNLPVYAESYNPPPEYIFSKEQVEKWESQEPEERKLDFIPKMYSSLREVPAYPLANMLFERCLDLYLCARKRKMRVNVDPNELIPVLPKPRDLQPFPSRPSFIYNGHSDMVRCIDVHPGGDFLVSGSDDKTIKIWHIETTRVLCDIQVDGIVKSVAWCPSVSKFIILAAVENKVYVIFPRLKIGSCDAEPEFEAPNNAKNKGVKWTAAEGKQLDDGIQLIIHHSKKVKKVVWHAKCDFFASLTEEIGGKAIVFHRLSQHHSHVPFQGVKGNVENILFHPMHPVFFVVKKCYVEMYDLMKQIRSKRLMTNCKWASSIAVHPQGDNIIIGSYDCRLSWFDLDLSTKPYKTLRHHKKALRQVAYHKRYPLFASASDDGTVTVFHGMVYSDLNKNPLIVAVKILKGHRLTRGLTVLDCCFHPTKPWIFSSGSDSTIRLFIQ